jgi:hypothetical protein
MTQIAVPISVFSGPNVDGSPTTFFNLIGAGTVWECWDALGDTAHVNTSSVIDAPNTGGYSVTIQLGSLVDPGIDSGHKLRFRLKFTTVDFDLQLIVQAFLLTDIAGAQNIIRLVEGQIASLISSGELGAGGFSSNFVEVEIDLTALEIQTLRSTGGYSDSGFLIQVQQFDLGVGGAVTGSCDISYVALEAPSPGGGTPLVITGSGGFIFGGQGLGTDYFVPDGGFIFGGGGPSILYFDPLEYTAEGGFIFGGSAGVGGNQIVGTGGFIFGGGGREFMILSPDIGGIYFLDFLATHDTFYLRDGFQGTEDVKIPDPFIKTAYLGD